MIYKTVQLSPEDQEFLVGLKKNKEFQRLQEIIEMILQSRTWELLSSNDPKEDKMDALADITGGYNLIRYINDLQVKSEQNINENNEETS